MPQNSTRRPGATTSRSRFPAAAASWSLLGAANDVAARLLVGLEPHETAARRLFEEIVERAEAVVGFIEAGIPAFKRLLDHRAPNLLIGAALGHQRVERAEQQIESFLLLVLT